MPGEAGPPLKPTDAPSTPTQGVDVASVGREVNQDTVTSDHRATQFPDGGSDGRAVPTGPRKRPFVLLVGVAVLAYASDQLTKSVALSALADGMPRPFLGDVLRFRLIGNPGAALSLGAGNTWIMTLIAAGVLVAIVFMAKDLGSRAWALALGLLLGSAVGNLTDRFVRPPGGGQGHVVDFIDYNGWFIGNVADIWIVGAAGLIVLLAMLGIGIDGRRERDAVAGGPHTDGDRDQTTPKRAMGEDDA